MSQSRSMTPLLLTLLLALTCLMAGAEPAQGWLHTQGMQILDSQDHPVYLHGVNCSGMEYGTGVSFAKRGPATYGGWATPVPRMYDHLQTWGVNLVRLPVAWANLEPTAPINGKHAYNQEYLQALDAIIAELGKRHIAVILSMHQWAWSPIFQAPRGGDGKLIRGLGMPIWLYPTAAKTYTPGKIDQVRVQGQIDFFLNTNQVDDGLVALWRFLAKRYADNPTVVGADIFNEPGIFQTKTVKSIPLKDFYQRLGSAIQEANPHLLLVMQGGPHTPIPQLPHLKNMVLSFHMYPKAWDAKTQATLDQHLAKAKECNVPLWLGEFRAIGDEATPDGPNGWKAQTTAFLDYLKTHQIHWTYWAYQRAVFALDDPKVNTDLVTVLQLGM